jgi:hypothetical protein
VIFIAWRVADMAGVVGTALKAGLARGLRVVAMPALGPVGIPWNVLLSPLAPVDGSRLSDAAIGPGIRVSEGALFMTRLGDGRSCLFAPLSCFCHTSAR